ncbi:GNAT family N-acetyltransferase [Paenibacillus sp. JX-17]|uniref:GNAT family N-acetyltransferase n=1 Tax=Paenibacillus lacisoli TaxID=3064525 RepID=A0ABT9CKX0_9BACL|nr:GNAT family N-acetyltransferase [Paenibacillus sp. JX-17]MDO7908278.1 GNAT family N-acetyltransferase [Paenibacillus sp. JX-17]
MYTCKGYIPELETPRLKLRRMTRQDAPEIYRCWSDREVTRFMNISPMTSVEEAEEMIGFLNDMAEIDDAIRWGIVDKSTGRLMGSCGYNSWQIKGSYRGEIGYEIHKPYWRKGYMTEALKAILTFGFETMRLNRIEGLVDHRNDGSSALLASLGFTREGLLRQVQHTASGFKDMQMYSLLYEEWQKGDKNHAAPI